MKTKHVKILSLLLATLLMLGIFSGCNTNTNNADTENNDSSSETETVKWVLTHEKSQHSDEFSDPSIYLEKEYRYDSSGRLIYEKQTYDKTTIFTGYDYKYDDNGKVISKSMKETSVLNSDYVNYSNWTYQYDENGNCINETVHWLNDNSQDVTDYEYNDKGNVIKEHFKYDGVYSWEGTKICTLTYENGKCIQNEILYESTDTFGTTTSYMVYQYEYDANGNMSVSRYYTDIDNVDEAKNPVQINGRYYKLDSTTYYTYEKLADIATDDENSGNNDTPIITTTTPPETTTKKKLSDNCDEILATATNSNGDYYEIVANRKEDYTGLVVSIGIIKNNNWLLEPTPDMPFASDTLKNRKVHYIGNNCFLSVSHVDRINYFYCVYNATNGKSYEFINRNYSAIPIPSTCDDEYMIINLIGYSNKTTMLTLLNTTTMETKEVWFDFGLNNGYCDIYGDTNYQNISEGLFAATTQDDDNLAFYDINGNVVIDLSEYKASEIQKGAVFVNGKCTIEIKNNNGTKYKLTIDKKGNVLNSVEIK